PVTSSGPGFYSLTLRDALPIYSTCQVACLSQPCVSNVHCTVPVEACDGEHITVKGFATNCDTERAADITVILTGPTGEIGRQTYPAGAHGGTPVTDGPGMPHST